MKNITFLIFGVVFYSISPINGICKNSEIDGTSEVVGTVKEDKSSCYAIIRFSDNQRNKLYMVGDLLYSKDNFLDAFSIQDIGNGIMVLKNRAGETLVLTPGERIPIEGANMIFVKTINASVLEYSYVEPSKEIPQGEIEDFALRELDDKKVSLEKRYKKEERSLFDSPKVEDIEQPRLKSELFLNIKLNKIGENEWLVDEASAKEAVQNAEKVLFSIIKSVEPKFRFGEGPSLNFKSEVGDVTLNSEGFVVRNLAIARLGESMGIREGDLIKKVNGQVVNSLLGLFRAYMSTKQNPDERIVKVELVREGKPLFLTYRIK